MGSGTVHLLRVSGRHIPRTVHTPRVPRRHIAQGILFSQEPRRHSSPRYVGLVGAQEGTHRLVMSVIPALLLLYVHPAPLWDIPAPLPGYHNEAMSPQPRYRNEAMSPQPRCYPAVLHPSSQVLPSGATSLIPRLIRGVKSSSRG